VAARGKTSRKFSENARLDSLPVDHLVASRRVTSPGSNDLGAQSCGLVDLFWQGIGLPDVGKVAFFLVTGVADGVESGLGTMRACRLPGAARSLACRAVTGRRAAMTAMSRRMSRC
jgi:hypothetical protein